MAIAYRSGTTTAYGSHTNTTINVPAGVTNGDLLIAMLQIETRTLGAVTLPAGWTTLYQTADTGTGSGSNFSVHLIYRIAASEPSSYTFTHASLFSGAAMVAYSGVNTASPFDGTTVRTGTTSGSGENAIATGLTTTQANDQLVITRGSWDGGAITAPTNWTERIDAVEWIGDRAWATASATGDVNVASGNGAGAGKGWITSMLALKMAGPGTITTVAGAATADGGVATLTGSANGTITAVAGAATATGGNATLSAPLPGETARTTGTTAGGIPYTRVELTIGGDPAIAYFPTGKPFGTSSTAIVVAHGAVDDETFIDTHIAATTAHSLDNGWVLISPYAGGDTFANSTAYTAHVAAADWINTLWPISRLVWYGFSMGANAGVTHYVRHSGSLGSYPIQGMVLIDLPWDVAWHMANGSAWEIGLIDAAYGGYDAAYDPATYAASTYTGMKAFVSWSYDDTVAIAEQDALALMSYAASYATFTSYQSTGDHEAPQHFAPTEVNAWLDSQFLSVGITAVAGQATASGGAAALTADAAITAAVGDATATGGTAALTAAATLASSAGDAAATGGNASLSGGGTITGTAGDATAAGGNGDLTASVTLTGTSGAATADGGTAALTAGGAATIAGAVGAATAAGGTAGMTAPGTLTTDTGGATAEGAVTGLQGGASGTITGTVGSADAIGGTATLTTPGTIAGASGAALAEGSPTTLTAGQAGTLSASTGTATAAGSNAELSAYASLPSDLTLTLADRRSILTTSDARTGLTALDHRSTLTAGDPMPQLGRNERIWIPGALTVQGADGNPVTADLGQYAATTLPITDASTWLPAQDNDGKPGWLVSHSGDGADFVILQNTTVRVRLTTPTEVLTADVLIELASR